MSAVARFLAAAAFVFGVSAYVDVAAQTDALADVDAKMIATFEANWAKGDAKALAAIYDVNAVQIGSDGVTAGRAAIEKRFAANFSGPMKQTTVKITRGTTQSLSATIRTAEGTYAISGAKDASGKAMGEIHGRYLNTIVKKGGTWLIASSATLDQSGASAMK